MTRLILFVLLIIIYPTLIHSQSTWSEIIESNTFFEVKGNKLNCKKTQIVQINDRMGENDSKIRFYYNKGDKLNIKEAYIEDASGKLVRKLKKNDIIDQSAVDNSTLYSDSYVKWFELKHNTYPYRIIYSYEYETPRFLSILDLDYSHTSRPHKCPNN